MPCRESRNSSFSVAGRIRVGMELIPVFNATPETGMMSLDRLTPNCEHFRWRYSNHSSEVAEPVSSLLVVPGI